MRQLALAGRPTTLRASLERPTTDHAAERAKGEAAGYQRHPKFLNLRTTPPGPPTLVITRLRAEVVPGVSCRGSVTSHGATALHIHGDTPRQTAGRETEQQRPSEAQRRAAVDIVSHVVKEVGRLTPDQERALAELNKLGTDRARNTFLATLVSIEDDKKRNYALVGAKILQDIWDKFVQLAAGAGMGCTMRGRIGHTMAAAWRPRGALGPLRI